MNPYLDIFLLSLLVVYIVDLSGFTEAWLSAFSRWLGRTVREVRPFTCSLCMVWWTGVVYAIVTGRFCLPILAYTALLSYLSMTISHFMIFINELLLVCISKLQRKIS